MLPPPQRPPRCARPPLPTYRSLQVQPTPERQPLIAAMLSQALTSMTSDRNQQGGLKGALYYQGWTEGTSAAWWTLAQGGRFGILPSDPAYPQIPLFAGGSAALEQTLACPDGNALLFPVFSADPTCTTG